MWVSEELVLSCCVSPGDQSHGVELDGQHLPLSHVEVSSFLWEHSHKFIASASTFTDCPSVPVMLATSHRGQIRRYPEEPTRVGYTSAGRIIT